VASNVLIPLGNIRASSILEIMEQSEIMKKLALYRIPDGCIACRYKSACRGGGKCVTYAMTGSLNQRDVKCFYKGENKKR